MAEAGIGVDIVEISRMKSILEKTPSFARRVFTEEERAYCDASSRPAAHYASRFASREAVLKALGTGFSQAWVARMFRLRVINSANRKRCFRAVLSRSLKNWVLLRSLFPLRLQETWPLRMPSRLPKMLGLSQREKVSTKKRVAQTFKEARSVLDELEQLQNSALTEHLGDASQDTLGA